MKKVLLVGKLNQVISSVNRTLATRFMTQISMDDYEMVKGMTQIFNPEMVVVSLIGVGALDKRILDFFQNGYQHVPVVLLGTKEECEYYKDYYESKQFDYAERPITVAKLLQKCLEIFKISDEEETKMETKAAENQKKRVLEVDDSPMLLRSLKGLLEEWYEVGVATSGEMAIQQAKRKRPDIILLDYEMPGWDGKKTLEELRNDEELKNIPVIFVTGVSDKNHILEVLQLKPEGYLLKPVERDRLSNTIVNVLSGIV